MLQNIVKNLEKVRWFEDPSSRFSRLKNETTLKC